MTVVLLGPQRFDPTVAGAAEALGVEGPFAIVTAGWQEREREDDELRAHLGEGTVNLRLHRRADEVFHEDPELAAAYRARSRRFHQLQDFYRVRLEHLLGSARVIANRSAPPELLEEENRLSIDAIRVLDRHHQRRCDQVRREFREQWAPLERDSVARHREELRALLEPCGAIAIAGGHVASLLNRLQLFDLASLIDHRHVLAWSAGAMSVTEQVVIFHDWPPNGADVPQILEVGLGLVSGIVALPCPEGRLAVDDPARMAVYARRFAPSTCVVLPRRSWVVVDENGLREPHGVQVLSPDGRADTQGEVAA